MCSCGSYHRGNRNPSRSNITESSESDYSTQSSESESITIIEGDLEYTSVEGGYYVSSCKNNATNIVIPEKINGENVIGILDHAFENLGSLRSITIPNTVIEVQEGAFLRCRNLQSVYFQTALPN